MSAPVAKCPACGASIRFRFSAAVQTVCEYCNSILVRHDLDLEKVGEVADLPQSTSPIQLGTEGVYRGSAFTVTGRIIYEWEQGGWNEWHIVFQDGKSGWLSDAQAEYAVSFLASPGRDIPPVKELYPGKAIALGDTTFQVGAMTLARYRGVEGDLPFEYWNKDEIRYVDLRSEGGRFATIDYSEDPPLLFGGEMVSFPDLRCKNLRAEHSAELGAGAARSLTCSNCGAAVSLRAAGQSVSAVCTQCLSVLDASNESLRVIGQYQAKERVRPLIPLGATGKLAGVDWENVGFQSRSITADGIAYSWHEYVLFHRERGFRYLTQYDGHWNFVEPLATAVTVSGSTATHKGETYRHFQKAVAATDYVIGEFPWRVKTGERAEVNDYVAPPRMLSSERTDNEVTWSLGEYVEGRIVWEAFRLPGAAPPARGIYANQPSPHREAAKAVRRWTWYFALALVGLYVLAVVFSANKVVFRGSYRFHPGAPGERSFVTPIFNVDGRATNVEVNIHTDIESSWIYFQLALINDDTGQAWDWGREVSKYGDEGSNSDSSIVSLVPSGRYYLRVEPEWTPEPGGSSIASPVNYSIVVKRDVPVYWPLLAAFPLLLIPALYYTWRDASFETRRWLESDTTGSGGGRENEHEDEEEE